MWELTRNYEEPALRGRGKGRSLFPEADFGQFSRLDDDPEHGRMSSQLFEENQISAGLQLQGRGLRVEGADVVSHVFQLLPLIVVQGVPCRALDGAVVPGAKVEINPGVG